MNYVEVKLWLRRRNVWCYETVVLCWFDSSISLIRSVGEEIRQLAPARVSSSGVDMPYVTPTAKTCSS